MITAGIIFALIGAVICGLMIAFVIALFARISQVLEEDDSL